MKAFSLILMCTLGKIDVAIVDFGRNERDLDVNKFAEGNSCRRQGAGSSNRRQVIGSTGSK